MNRHKLRRIVEFLAEECDLVDYMDRDVNLDNIMTAYALDEILTKHELIMVKLELADVREADKTIRRLKLAKHQHDWTSGTGRPD